jgi:hypothetical protein
MSFKIIISNSGYFMLADLQNVAES